MKSSAHHHRLFLAVAFSAGLAWLARQIGELHFLCDDAFISFRYARNLFEGQGLVFNAGEHVEGYSNFLWTLWSAAGLSFGASPGVWANAVSIFATAALLVLVVVAGRRWIGDGWMLPTAAAFLYLCLHRSFAVWATGGLETRFFSLLLFAAISTSPLFGQGRRRLAISSVLFALAGLTRTEAYLFWGLCFLPLLWSVVRNRPLVSRLAAYAVPFIVVALSHLVFRLAYYGSPLPNTFYAKVGGEWFSLGLPYLGAFVLEYQLWMVMPLILFGLWRMPRLRKHALAVGLLFFPYLFYLAYIGGDHFEFRQLDIVLPFLALGIGAGFAGIMTLPIPWQRWATVAGAALIAAWSVLALPQMARVEMRDGYRTAAVPEVDFERCSAPASIPGFRGYAEWYSSVYSDLVSHLGAIRAEEHAAFLEIVTKQAMTMNRYVDRGIIDSSASLSLICVGVIPYYTGLTTIDYNGLTDIHVARSEEPPLRAFERRLIAHEKGASRHYLEERGVDYIFSMGHGFFSEQLPQHDLEPETYIVKLPEHYFAFRTTKPRDTILARFGRYPTWYSGEDYRAWRIDPAGIGEPGN